ncbi:GTPase Der [Candidatus Gugararchaeum adminiculabundum]|nr:GTPase Der [Candidatus Gugararchaeum adminiculabundum]
MAFEFIFSWISKLFGKRKEISLGLYGAPNAGKTTLANRICMDFLGEPMGVASEIPHETRAVQKKEKVEMKVDGKRLTMNLLDMPGIANKVDYRAFLRFGLNKKKSQERSREAAQGIIEAMKWLEHVDAALVVLDASEDPQSQANLAILGNLEAMNIPAILVANKMDLKKADSVRIRGTFPGYSVVEVSALEGTYIDKLYETICRELS